MLRSFKVTIHTLVPLALLSPLSCGEGDGGAAIDTDAAGASSALGAAPDSASPPLDDVDLTPMPAPCSKSANVSTPSGWAPAQATPGPASCGPTIAAQTFSSALCSCEDTTVAGLLHTRSFRSRDGEQTPERLGGSVGVNRSYFTGGLADVGGSLTVAGQRDVTIGGLLRVGGDLSFNPSADVAGLAQIGRDASLVASVRAIGVVGIGRDLYQAPGSRFLGLALVNVAGQRYAQPLSVAPPCACGASELLDVAALVADARVHNDNASVGLDSHALDLVVGVGTVLTLPSGRYHLHELAGAGALRVRMSGKVALFIDGDLHAGPLFHVSLDAGAELDLFVQGSLVLAGAALIGDPVRPSATRIYAGGSGDIAVAGLSAFAGNLYAPEANVLVGGVGRVFGSLFGKNIIAAGVLDVGYDESVRDGQVECPPPGDGDPPGDGPRPDDGPRPGDGDPDAGAPGGPDAPTPCAPGDLPTVY